jgi:ferredoxin
MSLTHDVMADLGTCALCPRLCRPACPVAMGSAREASVPSVIASALRAWSRGELPAEVAREAATLCVDCGACTDHCYLHQPLPEAIRAARSELGVVVVPEALGAVEGEGGWCAISADARDLAGALAAALGAPVRSLRTGDRLGALAVDGPAFAPHAARLRGALAELRVVTADGGVATALEAAGVAFSWLHEVVPDLGDAVGSCRCGAGGATPLACCGAAGPLREHHPDDAERVGRAFLARMQGRAVRDARCGEHLRRVDARVEDDVDRLIALVEGG